MYETKIDTSGVAWSPTGWAGVSIKMLDANAATGGVTGMIKMSAGSSIPAHKHTQADQTMYVLEGELVEEGVSCGHTAGG